ncbi:MAG: hypothetical protein GWP67_05230 [Gammaproteobacteria bacterium]|jgi:hypothetical protein|nr:hypothetical protein [Gammaproteobacteria bacterium]
MKLIIAILFLISLPVAAENISNLTWLSGCWAYDDQDSGSGEYWMSPAGGTMLAVSRSVRDGRTVAFEYLRISEDDEHSLILFASPSGQSQGQFYLASLTDKEIVFENPEHDFPQRIIYRLRDNDRLLGRIEGQSDGQPVGVDFPMTRRECKDFGS